MQNVVNKYSETLFIYLLKIVEVFIISSRLRLSIRFSIEIEEKMDYFWRHIKEPTFDLLKHQLESLKLNKNSSI